jgi:long-chain acyl-CoA synthetase
MMNAASTVEDLTRPGAMFELQDWRDGERTGKCWKNGPQTLIDIFRATQAHGDKPFLACGKDMISYSGFRGACDRLVGLFRSLGIGRGDVIAVSLSHEPEWIATFFAAARIGAITAPMNPVADNNEFTLLLEMSKAVALVADERAITKLGAGGALPKSVRHILVARGQPASSTSVETLSLEEHIGAVSAWTDLASTPAPDHPPAQIQPDDGALILFTSGTTGRPKAVLLSHRCCAYSVFHAAYRNARNAILAEGRVPPPSTQREALLMVLPLFHASGCRDALIPLMVRGGLVVTMPFWSPGRACSLIEQHQVTILAMVPSIADQFMRYPDFARVRGLVKQVIYGGGPPSVDLPRLVASHGATPGQNWGMTETGGAAIGHVGAEYLSHPASCGRPAPILSMRIVGPDGAVLPPNQAGELQVSGPQVMKEYWGDPVLTAEFVTGGWLKTGDVGIIDDGGYCSIVDRAKDMIITAGENIYCPEIETALRAHPKIEDAAVIGAPHEGVGERPLAIVVVKDGVAPPSEMDVRIFVAGHLAPAKIPAAIIYRSAALPRNSMGKLEKTKLRQEVLPGLR